MPCRRRRTPRGGGRQPAAPAACARALGRGRRRRRGGRRRVGGRRGRRLRRRRRGRIGGRRRGRRRRGGRRCAGVGLVVLVATAFAVVVLVDRDEVVLQDVHNLIAELVQPRLHLVGRQIIVLELLELVAHVSQHLRPVLVELDRSVRRHDELVGLRHRR